MAPASPVDRGWAWAVLIGAHVSMMLSDGYVISLGVFYIEWKEYFDADATAASWLLSLPLFVASPLSFFVGILASRVGVRWVSMAGAAVTGLATILGSFTTDIRQLYACSAITGVGAVMVVSPATIILSTYFKKRYSLANGIAIIGAGVGQMIFPPLIRLLITKFGWRGAMFIIGSLQMNGVAACALFRPLKFNSDEVPNSHEGNGTLQGRRASSHSQVEHTPGDSRPQKSRKYSGFLKVFGNIPAMLILLSSAFYGMGTMINISHLPARAKEAGWSDDQSAMLLFAFAILFVTAGLTHGFFVDRGYIGSFQLHLMVCLGAALITFLNPVSDSYVFLVVCATLIGTFVGISSTLNIINMRHLVSVSERPAAFSLVWATVFFSNGTGAIVAGKIFDATGNYVAPFLAGGAMFLVAFMLLSVVTVMKRRRDKQLKPNISRDQDVRYRAHDETVEIM